MDNNEAYSILTYPEANKAIEIFNRISGIKVKVIEGSDDNPEFDDSEVHFFGKFQERTLIFETIGYQEQGLDLVQDAIRWYAEYAEMPDLQMKNIEFDL